MEDMPKDKSAEKMWRKAAKYTCLQGGRDYNHIMEIHRGGDNAIAAYMYVNKGRLVGLVFVDKKFVTKSTARVILHTFWKSQGHLHIPFPYFDWMTRLGKWGKYAQGIAYTK